MSVLEDVNAMLLQNMLPRHVATHYTNLMQMGAVSDSVCCSLSKLSADYLLHPPVMVTVDRVRLPWS
jgi:hypothetical protein